MPGAVSFAGDRGWGAAMVFAGIAEEDGSGDVAAVLRGHGEAGGILPGGGFVRASGGAGDIWAGGAGEPGVRDAGGGDRGELHGPDYFQFAAGLGSGELGASAGAGDP